MQGPWSATASLDAARALGPFFAVDIHPQCPGPSWCSAATLLADPELMHARVTATRELLAVAGSVRPEAVDMRTAASLNSLGLLARLICPVLGGALLTGTLPVVDLDSWLLGPPASGPTPVAARSAQGVTCAGSTDLAAAMVEHCLDPVVRPVVDRIAHVFRLSTHVLWGNAASALAGAARMAVQARPELASATAATVGDLLQKGPLAGTGAWIRPDSPGSPSYLVRRSCCLLYRVSGASPCGDCILLRSDVWKGR